MINLFSWYLAVNIENRDRLKNSRTVDRAKGWYVCRGTSPSHARLFTGMSSPPPRPKDRVRKCSHNHRPHVRLGRCLKTRDFDPRSANGGGGGGGMSHLVSSCCNGALVVGRVQYRVRYEHRSLVGLSGSTQIPLISFVFSIHSYDCYWKGVSVCCFLLCCSRSRVWIHASCGAEKELLLIKGRC